MEIVSGLINAGGLGAAVAILYILHSQALKTFREELATERAVAREDRIADRAAFEARNGRLAAAIENQTETLIDKMDLAFRADAAHSKVLENAQIDIQKTLNLLAKLDGDFKTICKSPEVKK